MRLIDADELIEHAWRDKLDNRELIIQMITSAPTIKESENNPMKTYILKLTNNSGVSIDYEFSNNDDRREFTVKAVNADRMATISKIEFIEKTEVENWIKY